MYIFVFLPYNKFNIWNFYMEITFKEAYLRDLYQEGKNPE